MFDVRGHGEACRPPQTSTEEQKIEPNIVVAHKFPLLKACLRLQPHPCRRCVVREREHCLTPDEFDYGEEQSRKRNVCPRETNSMYSSTI